MLHYRIICIATAAVLFLPASAFSRQSKSVTSNAGQTLCKRVQLFSAAWTHADFKTMDRLLAPSYVHTDDTGAYQPRSTWLKAMHKRSANLKTLNITMHDIRIRMLGHTAVVTGEDIIGSTRHTNKPPEHLRFTQVWVNNSTGWQRLAFQATPVLKNIKFSHMKCTKSKPAVCTGRVKITLPEKPTASSAITDAEESSASDCTFIHDPKGTMKNPD